MQYKYNLLLIWRIESNSQVGYYLNYIFIPINKNEGIVFLNSHLK